MISWSSYLCYAVTTNNYLPQYKFYLLSLSKSLLVGKRGTAKSKVEVKLSRKDSEAVVATQWETLRCVHIDTEWHQGLDVYSMCVYHCSLELIWDHIYQSITYMYHPIVFYPLLSSLTPSTETTSRDPIRPWSSIWPTTMHLSSLCANGEMTCLASEAIMLILCRVIIQKGSWIVAASSSTTTITLWGLVVIIELSSDKCWQLVAVKDPVHGSISTRWGRSCWGGRDIKSSRCRPRRMRRSV